MIDIDKDMDEFLQSKGEDTENGKKENVNDLDSNNENSKAENDVDTESNNDDNKGSSDNDVDVQNDKGDDKGQVRDDDKSGNKDEVLDDSFDLESFNKAFESKYKDKEEIKTLLNSRDRIKELEGELKDKDELLDKKSDVMSYYASESMYKTNALLTENKDLNETVAKKLVDADFDKMSDEEVLVLQEMVDRPTKSRRSESHLMDRVKRKYNLTENFDDLDEDEQAEYTNNKLDMEDDAIDARKKLSDVVGNIKMPEKRDLKAEKDAADAEAAEQYNKSVADMKPVVDDFIKNFSKIDITDSNDEHLMDYEVSKEFSDTLKKNLLDTAIQNKIDPNDKKSVEALKEFVAKEYYWANRKKIAHALKEDALTESKDQSYKKYHNSKKSNDKESPKSTERESKNQATYDAIGQELS